MRDYTARTRLPTGYCGSHAGVARVADMPALRGAQEK
jgi:hypothetical protein